MIRVTSFNCHSIRNNLHIVSELLENNDILILQELMLHQEDINFISSINSNFDFSAEVKDRVRYGVNVGRPSGGSCNYVEKKYFKFGPNTKNK